VQDINQAVSLLLEHTEADSVRSVIVPFQNPFKMWKISQNGYLEPLIKTEYAEPYNMPRQLLPEVYWQTGYIDAAWSDILTTKHSMTENIFYRW